MVMPRSRSSSLESITRSTCVSLARKVPLWFSMASTRVVFPWSTCAMMAILRRLLLKTTVLPVGENRVRQGKRRASEPVHSVYNTRVDNCSRRKQEEHGALSTFTLLNSTMASLLFPLVLASVGVGGLLAQTAESLPFQASELKRFEGCQSPPYDSVCDKYSRVGGDVKPPTRHSHRTRNTQTQHESRCARGTFLS